MLYVIIQWPIYVLDLSGGKGHAADPMIVIGFAYPLRKWQHVAQEALREHRCGAGYRIRKNERSEILVVVGPCSPVRSGYLLALAADNVHVAVNQGRTFVEFV